ncbi:MAG TPA: alpha/beta hydrolase [Methanothrix sp.]|nr:alpha/beta hydrolase [Methanothrix sp.]
MSESEIIDLRRRGSPPYTVALLHGGPGARGEMAPVARALSSRRSVLEPLQRAASVRGQVEELRRDLEAAGDPPMALIGFSWGGWLGFIMAAEHPDLVRKLILVGSGPLEERRAAEIAETRSGRLTEAERAKVESIARILESSDDVGAEEKRAALGQMGALFAKVDAYDPLPSSAESEVVDVRYEVFQAVWKEAAELRRSGELLELGEKIECPVVAIHGDYDPHPAEGVRGPLSALLKNFRFILLEKCGHRPWTERRAREKFYYILDEELE